MDDVYLSHTLDPSAPNGTIRDRCMCDNMKISNVKDRLKHVFHSSVQTGKMLHNEFLKIWLKKLNLSTKYFYKMTNYCVDPKVLLFLQDIIVNSTTTVKSYLSDSNCDEIRKIEEMFISDIKHNNPDACNWINDHVGNKKLIEHKKSCYYQNYSLLIS